MHGYCVSLEVRATLKALDNAGLRAPVQISAGQIADNGNYPWIRPQDFVAGLSSRRRLDLLLPKPTLAASKPVLSEYWKRFHAQYGAHEIFSLVPASELEITVPIKIHGGEGRSILA